MPVLVLPVNCKIGVEGLPAGNVKIPVKVPPAKGRFPDAEPITLPVNVPENPEFAVILAAIKLSSVFNVLAALL